MVDISKKRDDAITIKVGDGHDASACVCMFGLDDSMYVVKLASIWKIQLADAIDPSRTNVNVPNSQQLFIDAGVDSETVRRTVLQAEYFRRSRQLSTSVKCDEIVRSALTMASGLERILNVRASLLNHFDEARRIVRKGPAGGALSLPKFERLDDEWTSFIDASDGARQCIRNTAFAYFDDLRKNGHWFSDFRNRLTFAAFESADHREALDAVDSDLEEVRRLRNAKEHPKEGQSAVLFDYRIMPDGSVAPPSVEIILGSNEPVLIDLAELCRQIANSLLFCYEMCLLWGAGSTVKNTLNKQVILARRPTKDHNALSPFCFAIEWDSGHAAIG